jgi:dCMP deaminase
MTKPKMPKRNASPHPKQQKSTTKFKYPNQKRNVMVPPLDYWHSDQIMMNQSSNYGDCELESSATTPKDDVQRIVKRKQQQQSSSSSCNEHTITTTTTTIDSPLNHGCDCSCHNLSAATETYPRHQTEQQQQVFFPSSVVTPSAVVATTTAAATSTAATVLNVPIVNVPMANNNNNNNCDGTSKKSSISTTVSQGSESITEQTTLIETLPAAATATTTPTSSTVQIESQTLATASSTTKTTKRTDYISWDQYFMAVAVLSSYRSKDVDQPTGACIVDTYNRIVGIGYNGFPSGCRSSLEDLVFVQQQPQQQQQHPEDTFSSLTSSNDDDNDAVVDNKVKTKKTAQQPASSSTAVFATPWLHTPAPYMIPAEINALLNKSVSHCDGARMYTQTFPNHECAKIIVQSRIAEVIYLQNEKEEEDLDTNPNCHQKNSFCASRILFTMAGVRMRQYRPPKQQQRLELNFTSTVLLEAAGIPNMNHTLYPNQPKNDLVTAFFNDKNSNSNNKQDNDDDVDEVIRQKHVQLLWNEARPDVVVAVTTNQPDDTNHHNNQRQRRRPNYLSWDDYFMSMAFLTAQRSKDPNTQVGACIVDTHRRIVGLGYNGFPTGCSDDVLPWSRTGHSELQTKYMYVCHAEVNAILNKGSANVRDGTLYVALFPCHDCSKMIIQAGIREVVYMSDRYHSTDSCKASRIMLDMAGVKTRNYIPTVSCISIELN